MTDAGHVVGEGTFVGSVERVSGRLVRVNGPHHVLELLESGAAGSVLLVDTPSATGIAPILPVAAAVICTSGGVTSHLALVAKEFGVACLVGTAFHCDPETLVDADVEVRADGTVHAA